MREHLPRIVRHASTPSPIASVWCAHQYSTNASPEPSSDCQEMNNMHCHSSLHPNTQLVSQRVIQSPMHSTN
jgi:hypothetical protein